MSIFNTHEPDRYTDRYTGPDAPAKLVWFDDAITVAKSFRDAGLCWDFHPATRNPNLLTTYGNINKNAMDLIHEAYEPETIAQMVGIKKLAVLRVLGSTLGYNATSEKDCCSANWKQWRAKPKKKMFWKKASTRGDASDEKFGHFRLAKKSRSSI